MANYKMVRLKPAVKERLDKARKKGPFIATCNDMVELLLDMYEGREGG